QCSLTVALPVLSACGVEACVLPSAVLSTHTCGFTGFTCRDLTDDMPQIAKHWEKENITFDGIYTGYLGSDAQINTVISLINGALNEGAPVIVDPAMADNGKLYPAFDGAYVNKMKTLVAKADYVVPNVTEACFLTDVPYQEKVDKAYVDALLQGLTALGAKNVILTGISYREGETGVVVYENGKYAYYAHEKLSNSCHGTGDIYASAFAGALLKGKTAYQAAQIAADFVVEAIRFTATLDNHWYGAAFEPCLPKLIDLLK
ncbi:MAG: pyridoxamine kinase, partial [Clostridia bacterium]|nr:pyridoxamine kinase [Clostridia bacterium]